MSRRNVFGAVGAFLVVALVMWWSGDDDTLDTDKSSTRLSQEDPNSRPQARARVGGRPRGEAAPEVAVVPPQEALTWRLATEDELEEIKEPFEMARGRRFYDLRQMIRASVESCLPEGPQAHMVQFMVKEAPRSDLVDERVYAVESVEVTDPGPVSDDVYRCLENAVGLKIEVDVEPHHQEIVQPELYPEVLDLKW